MRILNSKISSRRRYFPCDRIHGFVAVLVLFNYSLAGSAEDVSNNFELPEPLTIEYALGLAGENHPDVLSAVAGISEAEAGLLHAESNYAFNARLDINARAIDPARFSLDRSNDDSSVKLKLSRPLYDFGYTSSSVQAEESALVASQAQLQLAINQRRIDITRLFFKVILSDLKYDWDNEAMTIAYIRLDKVREQHALGAFSDVELYESQSRYQALFSEKARSELNQRMSRARLSEVLNRPGELTTIALMPALPDVNNTLPSYEVLLEKAMAGNQLRKIILQRARAAKLRVDAMRKRARPVLEAGFEAAEYARDSSGHHPLIAELTLSIPLYEDAGVKSDIAAKRADLLKQNARLKRLEMAIRQKVLNEWQQIQLLDIQRKEANWESESSEIEFDKRRSEYELEIKTNLGDAIVNVNRARFNKAQTGFNLQLAWMRLQLLMGETPGSYTKPELDNRK